MRRVLLRAAVRRAAPGEAARRFAAARVALFAGVFAGRFAAAAADPRFVRRAGFGVSFEAEPSF
jgi:hypothetical protein